ncbi:MAG: HNH endonuclease [Tabrizicola sp.]|nr:HNH endonuclease [Tabrizicola sp.]
MPTRERRAKKLGLPVDQLPDGRGRHGNHSRGGGHHRWNDTRILSSEGYIKVRVGADHPLADPNGYAYEHLLVWVSAGRPAPEDGELLHHQSEDKTDNRLENLRLMDRSGHGRLHIADRMRDEAGRLLDGQEHNAMPGVL